MTRGDTLLPFLRFAVGTSRWMRGLARNAPQLAGYVLGAVRNDRAKESLLTSFFQGWEQQRLTAVGREFAVKCIDQRLRPEMVERFLEHRDQGDVCLLVSASLEVYVRHWGLCFGFDDVLATRLEVSESGLVTGRFAGQNCHGGVKRARIEAWLDGRTPDHVVAYGDSRGDDEMLAFADLAYRVGGKPGRAPLLLPRGGGRV